MRCRSRLVVTEESLRDEAQRREVYSRGRGRRTESLGHRVELDGRAREQRCKVRRKGLEQSGFKVDSGSANADDDGAQSLS